MYIPRHHEQPEREPMHALLRTHPLGAWVTQSAGELLVNHIPFLFDAARGDQGTLYGHVARANPVWHSFSTTSESVVIFQGAQAYVSPSWYPSKNTHGKVVPTWNYIVIHARGIPRPIEDRTWLLAHVTQLSTTHEAGQAIPWKVSDAPPDYIDKLLQNIVGIEIPITKLIGKWKVSQNRPESDRLGVVAGLRERGDAQSADMAALVSAVRDA